MRKSTMMIMVILLVGFGGMLLAADMFVLGPAKKDLAVAKEIQGRLGERAKDWIVRESRVKVRTMKGTGERLAQDGSWGVAVQVEPTEKVLTTPARAQYMAALIAGVVREKGTKDKPISWVEVIFRVGEVNLHAALLRWDAKANAWEAPDPPIPDFWAPEDIPDFAPKAPDPGK